MSAAGLNACQDTSPLQFKETDGHLAFFKVNVICADLFSLATILHFFIHSWISSKLCCKIEDAIPDFCLLP